MRIDCRGEELFLDKERAIYFPKQDLLAVSDLHLGKPAHFRKAGIQVPALVAQNDLQRLGFLVDKYQPETLLVNGDMFHHGLNSEIQEFASWRRKYQELNLLLVKGNHDRLKAADYASMRIEFYQNCYQSGPFSFIHNAEKCAGTERYPIAGHIHPGITITGKAKQRLRLPCFYFGEKYALMPAFSLFTGIYAVQPEPSDRIFAITADAVIEV